MSKSAISAYSRSLYADEAGAQLVEYALLCTIIAVAVIATLTVISGNLSTIFSKIGNDL